MPNLQIQVGSVTLGPAGLGMIGLGVVALMVGAWVLLLKRPPKHPPGPRLAGGGPGEAAPRMSEPTRLTIALLLLVGGYHLIVWALPPSLVAVQLNRAWWWVWLLIGALGLALSVGMDRLDRRGPSEKRGDG